MDPSFVPNKEFVKKDDEIKKADLFIFSTPNGVRIQRNQSRIVDKVKRLYDGKPINGIIVHFHEVNGEEEEEDKMNEFEKETQCKYRRDILVYI